MRRFLLLVVLTVVFVGCKYEHQSSEIIVDGAVIPLSTGPIVAKAGNRDNTTGFLKDDKIGVTAYFSKKLIASSTEADEANFVSKPHFANALALALDPTGTEGAKVNTFKWDDADNVPRFFPQGKNIYLYAYYPYSDGTDASEGVTYIPVSNTSSEPPVYAGPDKLEVKLLSEDLKEDDGVADNGVETMELKQPDVLVSCHANSISRATTSIEDLKLTFNHLLAQVQFLLIKDEGVVGVPAFKSLTFKVPGKAEFEIGTPKTYTNLASGADDTTTYNVMRSSIAEILPAEAVAVLDAPIMVLPYTVDDFKKCKLELVITFEEYGDQKFEISLGGVTEGLAQGKLNNITLKINRVEITLTSTIAPWEEGNDFEIPVE